MEGGKEGGDCLLECHRRDGIISPSRPTEPGRGSADGD